MGSEFDLHDLLKPHLSPALLHWKRTRVSASQLDHNITIASTLTFQALVNISTTPHWKWTRILGSQIGTRDLESLTYLPGAEEASTGLDKSINRCTNEMDRTLPKAWGKSYTQRLNCYRYKQGMYHPSFSIQWGSFLFFLRIC